MADLADIVATRPRTQVERTATMKQRLIDATLTTLHVNGYAELTIGRVVEQAGVSRGAPLHHFASKAALIEAATEALVGDLSHKINELWASARHEPDPLRQFCIALWHDIFLAREGVMLAELSHASRRAPELAEIMTRLWTGVYRVIQEVDPNGSAASGAPNPAAGLDAKRDILVNRIIMLSQWLMRGMYADIHLGAPPALFESYINLWVDTIHAGAPNFS